MSQSTQSPWDVACSADYPGVYLINGAVSQEDAANAKIIAAAPDMLAALKRARTVLFHESAAENQPQLVGALAQVSDAIDKAEGRRS